MQMQFQLFPFVQRHALWDFLLPGIIPGMYDDIFIRLDAGTVHHDFIFLALIGTKSPPVPNMGGLSV